MVRLEERWEKAGEEAAEGGEDVTLGMMKLNEEHERVGPDISRSSGWHWGRCLRRLRQFAMAGNGNGNGNDNSNEKNAIPMEDFSWRVAKLHLEESNTRRFLKSKLIKLPYD